MTLKANPSRMTGLQTIIVLLVGAGAISFGALGLMDVNVVTELAAGHQTVQQAAYAASAGAGGGFLLEIFTESEILNVMD